MLSVYLAVRCLSQYKAIPGYLWLYTGMSVQDRLEGLQKGALYALGHQRRQDLLKAAFDA
jgi:hypothetical protein